VPLTKEDMINSIRGRCGLPKSKCSELIDGLFETITKTLESGEDVRISGFGKFSVRNQNKRRVRNPATGEAVILDARRVVTFKCASVFKERINWKDA
jgi:integration host factor subunit alpha